MTDTNGRIGSGTWRWLAAALVAVAFMAAGNGRAEAAERVICRVLTVEASPAEGGVDKALLPYAEVFAKPPFDGFHSFRLVHEKKYELSLGTDGELELPGELKGTLQFNGREGKALKLTLNLTRPDGRQVVVEGKSSSGTPFIAAGLRSGTGRWVIAVECRD